MALVTAANVRAEIQGLAASDDTELGLLIAEADALAAGWLFFPPPTSVVAPTLSASTYVDYLDGPIEGDPGAIRLRMRPATAIASIYDDYTRVYAAGSLVASAQYDTSEIGDGIVRLKYDATWAWGTTKRGIKVTYTAGWPDNAAPADLRRALLEIVGDLWRRRHVSGLPSATPIEQTPDLIPRTARQALASYRLLERAAGG